MRVKRSFSKETKQMLVEKYISGNYPSIAYAAKSFGVSRSSLGKWSKERGFSPKGYNPLGTEAQEGPEIGKPTVSEKKELSFLEPDPGPSAFKNDAEKADYYMLRAYYLEELFKLCDLDEVSKKKALMQLEQRVRERLARGDKSLY